MRLKHLFALLTLIGLLTPTSLAQTKSWEVVPEKVIKAEFQPLDGSVPIRLSDYKGGVVILAVWASWCGPCRTAVSGLAELNKEFAGRGVTVVGLTTEDPAKDAEAVREFISEAKPEFKLGWGTKEAVEAILGERKSVPQIIVVAGDSIIIKRFVGWSERIPKMLREATKEALTNPPVRQLEE